MSALAPLIYLETRMGMHKLKCALRQPARVALWFIFFVWFAAFLFTRLHPVTTGYGLALPDAAQLMFVLVPPAYLCILGMQIRAGAVRPPAAFSYPADARFLLGSHLPPAIVVFWLQLREAAYQGIRVFIGLFFLSWNFAATSSAFLRVSTVLLAAFVIAFSIRLPVFLAQRRYPAIPFAWFGTLLVAAGALAVVYPAGLAIARGHMDIALLATQIPSMSPGNLIVRGLTGDAQAALLLAACAALMTIAGSLAASDAYPELWESSARQYARRALIASGRGLWSREQWRAFERGEGVRLHPSMASVPSIHGEHAPRGAPIVLWREWIALRRSSGGLRWPLFWVVCAAVLGFAAGLAERGRPLMDIIVPLVALANMVIVLGSQSTVTLSSELRRPLFWLGDSRLRNRVVAWLVGTMLRIGPPLVAGAMLAGIALGSWTVVVYSAPVVLAGFFLVQSIGIATYVVLPGRGDMRGPGFMLRILTTYTVLGLPALGWALVQVLTQSTAAGVIVGVALALVEAWALVSFSAARLEENAMAYAAAEQH
ncbi:MAG: hypothetical protein JO195_02685 [Candidatus Eremiobacteraeota bacterium]|nr:hypothetical protein [Candidatus Eremiobacteraeota bacterium]